MAKKELTPNGSVVVDGIEIKTYKREADSKKLMQAINGELAKDGLHIPTAED